MIDPSTSGTGYWVLRLACVLPGLALILWALADGPMIGGGLGIGLLDGAVLAVGCITLLAGFLPSRFLANYLAFFISASLMLIIIEVMLQIFLRSHYFPANDFDSRVLFKLRPSASSVFTHLPVNGGETIVSRVNDDGFTGPDLFPQGARARILVYGDSFINALFTAEEDRFTARLQEELRHRLGREIEVINAGVAGYGPDQVLRRMETELEVFKPDLVVFGLFTGNDFGDLLRNRLYRLDEANELVENDFRLSPEQKRMVALNRHELVLARILRETTKRFSGRSRAFDTFDPEAWIKRAHQQHLREYDEFVIKGDNTVGAFAVDPYSADIASSPESPSSRYKIRMMDRIVARMANEVDAAGTPLLALAIPHPMDLLDGDHASGRIDRSSFPEYSPKNLTDAASKIFSNHAIPHVNLYTPFVAEEVNALFLKGGDDHWNEAGQALAAEIVADRIVGDGLMKRLSPTGAVLD